MNVLINIVLIESILWYFKLLQFLKKRRPQAKETTGIRETIFYLRKYDTANYFLWINPVLQEAKLVAQHNITDTNNYWYKHKDKHKSHQNRKAKQQEHFHRTLLTGKLLNMQWATIDLEW